MFITVKYGDDCSEVFNPDCSNYLLLQNIKERCRCVGAVELSDELGCVKNLRRQPTHYASDVVEDRQTLILLAVDQGDVEGSCRYTPMLTQLQDDEDFMSKINPKPSRRKDSGSETGSRRLIRRSSQNNVISAARRSNSRTSGTAAHSRKS